jgi:hypothetical protein
MACRRAELAAILNGRPPNGVGSPAARTDDSRRAAHWEALVSTLVRRLGTAVITGIMALPAIPASAQEITLGYQWQQISVDFEEGNDVFLDDSISAPLGFNFDVAGPISDSIDFVGQFDWSRHAEGFDLLGQEFDFNLDFMSFGGGIRWSSRSNPGVTPFVQALFGVTRSSFSCDIPGLDCDDFFDEDDLSSVDPMMQIGGGVVIPVGGWGPVVQFDYRRLFADTGVNILRFMVGARLGLP